jgi:hypothetical protein
MVANFHLVAAVGVCAVFFDPGMQVLQSRGELHEDAQARYDEARKCDQNPSA